MPAVCRQLVNNSLPSRPQRQAAALPQEVTDGDRAATAAVHRKPSSYLRQRWPTTVTCCGTATSPSSSPPSGVSTLGTATVPVALTFALLVTGYSASTVGLVLACQSAATVLLMLLGGAVADRWPRRALMIAADLLRCTSQSILAVLLLLGHPSLLSLLALAACGGIGERVLRASRKRPHPAGRRARQHQAGQQPDRPVRLAVGGRRARARRRARRPRRRPDRNRPRCGVVCGQRHLPVAHAGVEAGTGGHGVDVRQHPAGLGRVPPPPLAAAA